jgi:hypothetical protein
MRTPTAKKLIKEAGLEFTTQRHRFLFVHKGHVWFQGESRYFPNMARFWITNVIQNVDPKSRLNQLSDYLISKGYETKIYSSYLEITNLNENGEL